MTVAGVNDAPKGHVIFNAKENGENKKQINIEICSSQK